MEDCTLKTYEGMFLVDAGKPSLDEAIAPIQQVLDRNQAQVLQMKKWDERRLAYEIAGRRRGLYVLTYFKAPPERITVIERDAQLNEEILRVLILAADHLSDEQMAAKTPAESGESRREERSEGESHDRRSGGEQAQARPAATATATATQEQSDQEPSAQDESDQQESQ